jgi:predicted nuclease of predicted toxin-antitoxin system
LEFAAVHRYVVMTHDLDFGAMIAANGLTGPSVLQVRTRDVLPDAIGGLVLQALAGFAVELDKGALVTITNERGRARLLPFREKEL